MSTIIGADVTVTATIERGRIIDVSAGRVHGAPRRRWNTHSDSERQRIADERSRVVALARAVLARGELVPTTNILARECGTSAAQARLALVGAGIARSGHTARRRLTEAGKAAAVEMARAALARGEDVPALRDLGAACGISAPEVRKALVDAGIPRMGHAKSRRTAAVRVRQARLLRGAGATLAEIGKFFGVTRQRASQLVQGRKRQRTG